MGRCGEKGGGTYLARDEGASMDGLALSEEIRLHLVRSLRWFQPLESCGVRRGGKPGQYGGVNRSQACIFMPHIGLRQNLHLGIGPLTRPFFQEYNRLTSAAGGQTSIPEEMG